MASAQSPEVLPYTVASAPWDFHQRGSQRVVVTVNAPANAVRVEIPWRRRDSSPAGKNIVVVDAATGTVVANRITANVSKEKGTIAFQPGTVPGDYHIYFLPCDDDQSYGGYEGGYQSYQNTASSTWLSANGLPANIASLPAAVPQRIEARLASDDFWPMEVPMTAAEKTLFLASHPGDWLVIPEDRLHPVKMRDEMPYRWLGGVPNQFEGTAMRDEYFAFQLAACAITKSIQNVRLTFSDLTGAGGATIPASAFNCVNSGGTNWDGSAIVKNVTIAQGSIQPLWLGAMIPAGAAPGQYQGTVTVSADNAPSQTIGLTLQVDAAVAVRHGDDDPVNHSRLRWLDSQLGTDDVPVAPYTAMTRTGRTVGVLGRNLTFAQSGLPESIRAGATEVLGGPVQFVVEVGGVPVTFTSSEPVITTSNAGRVEWHSTSTGGGLTMLVRSRMEFDGHVRTKVTLTAGSALNLSASKLKIPLSAEASRYMAGIGYDGGLRPASYSWNWTTPHDSVWIGGVTAGLHAEFRGGSYHGPLLNLYHPAAPPTWGSGSVTVANAGTGAQLEATCGAKSLAAGASVDYEFALLITPVKPVDLQLQFGDRYYHDPNNPTPTGDWQSKKVNVINVHHSNSANPFINWPFTDPAGMNAYISDLRAQGAKVKYYYTVREVTQKAAEIWALRSLGNEILSGGGGGGFPWLREHLVSDYSPAWFQPLPTGDYDAAITTARDSRWYNYYVEGVNWLAQNSGIDGLYLDDVAFDRTTIKRARKVLCQANPGARIDLHSNTGFSSGPINQYAEFLPYLDRLWFGESFYYDSLTPEQWLVRASGVPFGVMGEMLHEGGNRWLGAVFGMTNRLGWTTNGVYCDPRPVWKIWDLFGGLEDSAMRGWWDASAPVTTGNANVKATCFVKNGKTLVAVGNFSSSQQSFVPSVDWGALGLNAATASFWAPTSSGFQGEALYQPGDTISIPAKQGYLFILQAGNEDVVASTVRLAAHYRLSETSGANVIDETGAWNGLYQGSPTLGGNDVPAVLAGINKSATFAGGQYAELPGGLADEVFRSGDPWTVSYWVRPTPPVNTYNATFTWMDASGSTVKGILFYLRADGSLDFWIGNNANWNQYPNYNPGTGLQDRWYHVTASYDGATLRAYLDGTLVKTAPISSFEFPAAGRPITLGLRPGASPGADLKGRLTDVRIYKGRLSDRQIRLSYLSPGATVKTWKSSPASGLWSHGANWQDETAAKDGDALEFGASSVTEINNDLPTDTVLARLEIRPDAGGFNIAGNRLILDGDVVNRSSEPQRLGIDLSLVGGNTIDVGSSSVELAGSVAGTGGLTKSGGGKLVWSGVGSFSGPITLGEGTLELSETGLLGSGTLGGAIVNQGTLVFKTQGMQTLNGIISGSGAFTLSGTGRIVLNAVNTYAGITSINAGTLEVGAGGSLPSASAVGIAGAGRLSYTRAGATIPNAVNGSGMWELKPLDVSSYHLFDLTGTNGGYNGSMTCGNAALVNIGGPSMTPGASSSITVASGGQIYFDDGCNYAGRLHLAGNGIVGSGSIYGNLRAALHLYQSTISGTVTLDGDARIGAGNAGNDSLISGGIDTAGHRLTFINNSTNGASGAITVSGAISGSGAVDVINSAVNGFTLTLSGANKYGGNTTVTNGTLRLENGGSLGLRPLGNGVTNSIGGNGAVRLDGLLVLDLAAADLTVGNSWQLVDVAALAETYDAAFGLKSGTQSFVETSPGSGIWNLMSRGREWPFSEATGLLTIDAVISDYTTWADANAPGQALDQDHDHDGIPNGIEYFMGLSGSGFTSMPAIDGNFTVAWPKGASYSGAYGADYKVQVSDNLADWADVLLADPHLGDSNPLRYTIPRDASRKFVRLVVAGP